jgi:Zn-dependent M32 family carboxypeptidase
MDKKFFVNGREKEWFYLTNRELVDLLKDEKTSEEDKKYLNDMLLNRFERENCPNVGEDEHNVFAKQISNFVNGKCHDMEKTARLMANDHRYLVQEMFKLFIAFAKELSNDFSKGSYDERNQWACKKASEIMGLLKR